MARTFYVRDHRTGSIVNAVSAHGTKAEVEARVLPGRSDSEHLYLDEDPPMAVLQRYRYWNERP